MTAQEFLDALVAMGGGVSFNRWDGRWYAHCPRDRSALLHASGASPIAAVADLHTRWVAAGSPACEVYTAEEISALESYHRAKDAIVSSADLPPHPFG